MFDEVNTSSNVVSKRCTLLMNKKTITVMVTPSSPRSPGPLLVNVVVLSDVVLFLQVPNARWWWWLTFS